VSFCASFPASFGESKGTSCTAFCASADQSVAVRNGINVGLGLN
jgi:hypothetical protein